MHLLLQVWNEIIADNEHKLGKLGESKFIHHDGQWRGIVMFTPTLRCECAQPGLIDTMRKWCIDHFRITAIWPGDRIRRPEHPTENEVRRCSCDESV